jgi:sulfide:quinone oxidoreductase
MSRDYQTSRRAFLALAAARWRRRRATRAEVRAQEAVPTNARIVIVGAGAAGTALANRLSRRLEGAQITMIDPRPNTFTSRA